MVSRCLAVLLLFGIASVGGLSLTPPACAETLVESNVETRLIVGLHVGQAEVQGWLPASWQANSLPAGPIKGANLLVVFIDLLLSQDSAGKPADGGLGKIVVLVAPAKHRETGESALVVTRGFFSNPFMVPGPYKNGVQAAIRREQAQKGANVEAGAGDDFWEVQDTRGGIIEVRVRYQGALPLRDKTDSKIYSAVEPSFFRIYRWDRLTDVVKSIPAGVDRVQSYSLRVDVPELRKLFDGSEQLVGIIVQPSVLRRVFLP